MSAPKLKVLLLENDPHDAYLIAHELKGVAVVDVALNRGMFEEMLEERWNCILCDLNLPDIEGTEAIRLAKAKRREVPIIIVTGSVSPREADAACEAGASRFFMKTVDGVPGLAKAIVQVDEAAQLQDKAIRSQRLEILGELSAGIVHDFNGILSVMMMGAEQLRTRICPQDERVLDTMLSAAKRGAEMTGQVLAFARGTNGTAFKPVSPEYLLTEVGRLVRTTFPPNIKIETDTVAGTSQVKGDATQLAQVLANLATNARDAMPKGGVLRITAQNAARIPDVDGPCVVITVADTGEGISEDALPHIFTPWFTTKPVGQGTGLGLATVKRIVEAHHGEVKVLTGPGGTTFFLHLPIALPWTSAPEPSTAALDGQGRTVLLCDDQQSFRDLAQMILEGANYKVIATANGPEALAQFRTDQVIDVLLTDLSMSPMDGTELARNLRSVGLTLPIIYLSGFDAALAREPAPDAVLQKPVSREKLLSTLATVLTAKEAPGTLAP